MATHVEERPVFVSPDGRRRKRARWLGRALAGVLAAWVVAVAIGAAGFLHMPPLARLQVARFHATPAMLFPVRASHAHPGRALTIARRLRLHQAKLDSE